MTSVMKEKIGTGANFTVVNLKGDGYEVKQSFNKKYVGKNGEVNEGILCIAHKIYFERAVIERKFERLKSDLKQGMNRELEAEIHTHESINSGWARRLTRLNELLVLLETGEFSLRCTLEACPDHSENNGICHCSEDLTEALKHFPDFVGCAKGRELLNIDARRYGEPALLDAKVTVIRRRLRKK